MIRSELRLTVRCDRCTAGLTHNPRTAATAPVVFTDRRAALGALATAITSGGWVRMFSGRLLCPPCAAAQTCTDRGHDYGGPGGWRMCACDRSIPSHADAPPDPAGGDGCGMTWRLCGRCDHIDEHPITDHPGPTGEDADDGDGDAAWSLTRAGAP